MIVCRWESLYFVHSHNNRSTMSYWRVGRGRGRGYGRGAGSGRGLGQGLGYGSGQGSGRGPGPNPSPFCRRFPDRPRGWWANPAYSNVATTPYPQQIVPQYQYVRPPQYMQPSELLSYPQPPLQSLVTHMNCVRYSNGLCTLRGTEVAPNGPTCPSFAPATW